MNIRRLKRNCWRKCNYLFEDCDIMCYGSDLHDVVNVFQQMPHQGFCPIFQGTALRWLPGGKIHDHLPAFVEKNYFW